MRLEDFRALFNREGQWALQSAEAFAPREKDFLSEFSMLAKRFPRDLARSALTTAILRGEAEGKFPQADKMYFTREALEQATPWQVAAHRAKRYQGADQIVDMGCSIGGDALALAVSAPVIGVELDELRAAMAQENGRALQVELTVVQADVSALPLRLTSSQAVFFDPARRTEHGRIYSIADYQPPLSLVHEWLQQTDAVSAKISPGVQLEELAGFDCEVEFVSLEGALKEAALWFGRFKTAERRATLLQDGQTHTLTAEQQPELPLSEPRAYLYEPDAAVLRAGLVQTVGADLDAAQLDPEIAYLTADRLTQTPFARVWPVLDWMPFQLKRLRAALRERNIGQVTVKKRGSPIVPEELIQQLKLEGEGSLTLFLTQMQGAPVVIFAGDELREG
ncbi:MAG TPA: class I SAM-dependent methyltransferase [Firmicutes bacterium]|nr:class I SAM-dependent methyltransferase [Bacillota bacterium]